MIVFDLRCGNGHVFEAWFGTSADFEEQQRRGLVCCPVCASCDVGKAVMAPAVGAKGNQIVTDTERKAALKRMAEAQAEIEAGCDYVGNRFVTEARSRHASGGLGAGKPGLIGEATIADAIDLIDDGIPVQALPFRPRAAADA